MSEQVIAEQVKGISADIFERAKAAIDKKPAIGNDVDLDNYIKNVPIRERLTTLNELESGIKERALTIGLDSTEANRSGSFFQHDQTVVLSKAIAGRAGSHGHQRRAREVRMAEGLLLQARAAGPG